MPYHGDRDFSELTASLDLLSGVLAVFAAALHEVQSFRPSSHLQFFSSTLLQLSSALGKVDYADESLRRKHPPAVAALPDRVAETLDALEELVLRDVQCEADGWCTATRRIECLIHKTGRDLAKLFDFRILEDTAVLDPTRDAVQKCVRSLQNLEAPAAEPYPDPSPQLLSQRKASAEHWTKLYEQLSGPDHEASCDSHGKTDTGTSHCAQVNLGQLGPDAPEFRLLVSTCENKDKAFTGWYPVDFKLCSLGQEQNVLPQTEPVKWCEHMRGVGEAYKTKPIPCVYDNKKCSVISRRFRDLDKKEACPSLDPFGEAFPGHNILGSLQRKHLQILLVQTLWLLHDTPWLPPALTLETLAFLRRRPHPIPILQCSLWTFTQPRVPDVRFMMRFALLLLQIQCVESLEILQINNQEELDLELFDEKLNELLEEPTIAEQTPRAISHIVKICLDWTDNKRTEPTFILKEFFYPLVDELVQVFLAEFHMGFPLLLEKPQEIKPPLQPLPPPESEHTTAVNVTGFPGTTYLQPSLSRVPIRAMSSLSTITEDAQQQALPCIAGVSRSPSMMMYDEYDMCEATSSEESSAEGFLRRCDSFNEQHVRVNTGQPRVKIAVLDTGFNKCGIRGFIDNIKTSRKADRDFSEPIAGTKSFFETSSLEDECGHGTRVLSLLLRVAPNADYHVAKVSRTLQDNDPDAISRVVEALDWAIAQQVDLVNISFGFDAQPIKEIEEKLRKMCRKGIHIFAAAGNCGANERRAFPANDPDVFSVYASDGSGAWKTSMNPPAFKGHGWNTLGVGIKFDVEPGVKPVHKSGTSYATPLLVAIVANVFHVVRDFRAQDEATEDVTKARLGRLERHRHGVEAGLKLLSSHDSTGYIAPWRLWENDIDSKEIMSRLSWELRGC